MTQERKAMTTQEIISNFLELAAQRPLQQEELAQVNDSVPGPDAALGIRYTHIAKGEVRSQIRVNSSHFQPWGVVNGGVYCLLAESAASLGGVIAAGAPAVGVNNDTNFIKSVSSGVIEATATPVQLGGRTHLWRVDMHVDGTLVATSQVRLMILR